MSPLQKRLLDTYMKALAEQEEGGQASPAAPPPPAAQPVVRDEQPPAPAPKEDHSSARGRSDLYAKKMSELLLKGWKMLGENCPETGAVPLMQHPTSGRKFSIATGRYTDEPKAEEPLPTRLMGGRGNRVADAAIKAPSPHKPAASAPMPAPVAASSPALEEARKAAASNVKRSDDEWSEIMGSLMLKGWKMLNEQCPLTGLVPLMQHPTNGRKFSVAVKKFVDELDDANGAAADGAAGPPTPNAAAAKSPNRSMAVSVGEATAPDEAPVDEDDEEARAIQTRLLAPHTTPRAPPAAPASSPFSVRKQPIPPAPPPTRLASSVAVSANGSMHGSYTPGRDGLSALDAAAAAISAQLAWSAEQLGSMPPPPPKDLLDSISACAESLQAVEQARRALLE